MKIQKNLLNLFLICLLVGCEKGPAVDSTTADKPIEASQIKPDAEVSNGITDEEIEKLHVIAEDPNTYPAIAKWATTYLENINGFKAEEIRGLIAEYDASLVAEENSFGDDVSMEYRIDTNSQYIGSQLINTHYLNILSLSDSVDVDRVQVNRGNCNVQFRGGPNPVGYGQSLKFLLNCNPHDVREVKVFLKDGRELLMSPK